MVANINEYYHVRVQTLTSCSRDPQVDFPSSPIKRWSKLSITLLGENPHDIINETFHSKSHIIDWVYGAAEQTLFQEQNIFDLRKDILSCWQRFSIPVLLKIYSSVISIAGSYLDHCKHFMRYPISIPSWQLLTAIADTYSSARNVDQAVRDLTEATTKPDAKFVYGNLLSAVCKSIFNVMRLAAYYFAYKISPSTELILVSASYLGTTVEHVTNTKPKSPFISAQTVHLAYPHNIIYS